MKLTFTFKHMNSSDTLKVYAEEKSKKLSKFLRHPVDLHFFFNEEHGKFHTEMTLLSNHNKFVSEAKEDKDTHSVDTALDKMIAQLRKSKEKNGRG